MTQWLRPNGLPKASTRRGPAHARRGNEPPRPGPQNPHHHPWEGRPPRRRRAEQELHRPGPEPDLGDRFYLRRPGHRPLYSRWIVGWETSTITDTVFVEHGLTIGLWWRQHGRRTVQAGLIHHSDAGSQYTTIRYTDTLALEGLQPSIGSVDDAGDNATAETVMGLSKNAAVVKDSPRSGPGH